MNVFADEEKDVVLCSQHQYRFPWAKFSELLYIAYCTLFSEVYASMFYLVLPGAKKGNKLLSGSPMHWTRSNGIKLH